MVGDSLDRGGGAEGEAAEGEAGVDAGVCVD